MNDRIKELADQALQLVADDHTKGDTSRLNTDSYQVKDLINEKFAELIVKECVSLFDGSREIKTIGFLSHEQVVKQIKQHFGVKDEIF